MEDKNFEEAREELERLIRDTRYGCPSLEQLVALRRGDLSPGEEHVKYHAVFCDRCLFEYSILRALAKRNDEMKMTFGSEGELLGDVVLKKREMVLEINKLIKLLEEEKQKILGELQHGCKHESVVQVGSGISRAPSFRMCCLCALQTMDRLTHPSFGTLASPVELRNVSREEFDSYRL